MVCDLVARQNCFPTRASLNKLTVKIRVTSDHAQFTIFREAVAHSQVLLVDGHDLSSDRRSDVIRQSAEKTKKSCARTETLQNVKARKWQTQKTPSPSSHINHVSITYQSPCTYITTISLRSLCGSTCPLCRLAEAETRASDFRFALAKKLLFFNGVMIYLDKHDKT